MSSDTAVAKGLLTSYLSSPLKSQHMLPRFPGQGISPRLGAWQKEKVVHKKQDCFEEDVSQRHEDQAQQAQRSLPRPKWQGTLTFGPRLFGQK